jgi:hypothetical protein
MPRHTTGTIYRTASGWGIRWTEGDKRPRKPGFATKSEARKWFAANVAPRLDRGTPNPDLTFNAFCELFLARHGATVSPRTVATLAERLAPARIVFGDWKLSELEGAADDLARWRSSLTPTSRYRLTLALRQALGAAVRWGYIARNPPWTRAATPSRAPTNCAPSRASRSTPWRSSSARCSGRWSCSPPRPGCARTSGPRSSAATSTAAAARRWSSNAASPTVS